MKSHSRILYDRNFVSARGEFTENTIDVNWHFCLNTHSGSIITPQSLSAVIFICCYLRPDRTDRVAVYFYIPILVIPTRPLTTYGVIALNYQGYSLRANSDR